MFNNDNEEIWRVIPDTDGKYAVSNMGRVMRVTSGNGTHAGRILGSKPHRYCSVLLCIGPGHREHRQIHTLVAEAFIGPCPCPGMVPDHKNADKGDNRADNLEW